jgi:hypothetical protein
MRLSQEQRGCSSASECDEYLKKKCSALDRKTRVGCRDLPRMTPHTSSLLYGYANFRFAENPGLARQRSQPRLSEPIRKQVSGLSSGHKHVARRWQHLRPRSCVSSQNLNDRECDRDGNGEHRKQVARQVAWLCLHAKVAGGQSSVFHPSPSVGLQDQALTMGMTLTAVFNRVASLWIRSGSVSKLPSASRETLCC